MRRWLPPMAVHHQDGVGLGGVEVALGHVGDAEVMDDIAAFEREVADGVALQVGFLGMRETRKAEGGEEDDGAEHG